MSAAMRRRVQAASMRAVHANDVPACFCWRSSVGPGSSAAMIAMELLPQLSHNASSMHVGLPACSLVELGVRSAMSLNVAHVLP
jgi:hypothetical protein